MDCHTTKQNQVENHFQQFYRLPMSSLITLTTILPKTTFQLVVSGKKFFRRLRNKPAIVREGTGYPSRCTPISVMFLE